MKPAMYSNQQRAPGLQMNADTTVLTAAPGAFVLMYPCQMKKLVRHSWEHCKVQSFSKLTCVTSRMWGGETQPEKKFHDIVDRSSSQTWFCLECAHILVVKDSAVKEYKVPSITASLPPPVSSPLIPSTSVCVCVCVWHAQEQRASDLTQNLNCFFDLSKPNRERDARPSQRGLNIPESGHHNSLSPPSFPDFHPSFLCSLPPHVYPGYHWVSRGAGGKGERMWKRRGGVKKVKERLCTFKSQEDIWVHKDFDCFTHTGQSLDRSQYCPGVLFVCVYRRGVVWVRWEWPGTHIGQDLFKSW